MNGLDQCLLVAAANDAAVDTSVLAALSRGDAHIEHEFITLYRRLNDEDMAKLHQAVTDGDVAGALHASHRMAGAGRMIGAIDLAAVCGRVEIASRAGDLAAVKANMPALQLEIARVDAFFDSFLLARR